MPIGKKNYCHSLKISLIYIPQVTLFNFSNYKLVNSEKSVFSTGLGFAFTPGVPDMGNNFQDLDLFKGRVRLH